MKRIMLLSIATLMSIGFLACQRGEPAKTEEAPAAAAAPAPESAPAEAPAPSTEETEEDGQ